MNELDGILDKVTEDIMTVLLENPTMPYNKSTLAETAGVSRDALYRRWPSFVEAELVEPVPVGGRAEYYRLNSKSDIVNAIAKILFYQDSGDDRG